MTNRSQVGYLPIEARIGVFFGYAVAAYIIYSALIIGGIWRPSGGGTDLWFLSILGVAAARLIETPFFRKPADSLLSALVAAFALWAVDLTQVPERELLEMLRWSSIVYLIVILLTSATSILLLRRTAGESMSRRFFYRFSTRLGAPELLFTPAILISLFGFHDILSADGLGLIAVWLVLAVSRPLEEVVSLAFRRPVTVESPHERVGFVARIDEPNLVRVAVESSSAWSSESVLISHLPNGSHVLVLPLFSQIRENSVLGTGLIGRSIDVSSEIAIGAVCQHPECPSRQEVLAEMLDEDVPTSELVGFVVEGSNINRIQFEVAGHRSLREGYVVFCVLQEVRVYYQIVAATTSEETFDQNPRGTLRVTASQLGVPESDSGFSWHAWVPAMNTPVFQPLVPPVLPESARHPEGLVTIGRIPGTQFPVEVNMGKIAEFHAAVLGVTGMGKTELVLHLIEDGLRRGAKILCVDFTGEYKGRLDHCSPVVVGLSSERVEELEDLVDAVETGEYSAADEKKKLSKFLRSVHPEIATDVDGFLRSAGAGLAIFELEDIVNTRATLRATELYLSEIFRWAKDHRKAREILLVLEEAHTIIPEFNLFGYDRSDTAAVVGRMSQIALQGRKYGVGILLVSQRTALVSKTVLSQCNSFFCFSLVDKTSLEFMTNVIGSEHIAIIPNLRPRQLVAYGPGVHAEKPVIVEIPFDESKAAASAALNHTWPGTVSEEDERPANAAPVVGEDELPF